MGARTVDVVITTIGRRSLLQAIHAAISQTYTYARTVVVGDGPTPEARAMFQSILPLTPKDRPTPIYVETPSRLGGYGDYAKRWWIDRQDASEFIRFLDDDDWIPAYAISEMMREVDDTVTLSLCGLVMVLGSAHDTATPHGRYTVTMPELAPHKCCSGQTLFRTQTARESDFPNSGLADTGLALYCAGKGRAVFSHLPLYFYNGHQGGKVASTQAQINSPYQEAWHMKPPRSFRKSLFSRVPRENFHWPDGRPLNVYDQSLFRPMARIAKKTAWITRPSYFWDVTPAQMKSMSHAKIGEAAQHLIQRGYISDGKPYPPYHARRRVAPFCFLMPAWNCADKIGRAIAGIKAQRGDWECVISIDNNHTATAIAARLAIAGDKRFRVICQKRHLLAAGNVLAALSRIDERQVVVCHDGDDYLTRNDVIEELTALYSDNDVEIVTGTNAAVVVGGEDGHHTQNVRRVTKKEQHLRDLIARGGPPEDVERWLKLLSETTGNAAELADIARIAGAA